MHVSIDSMLLRVKTLLFICYTKWVAPGINPEGSRDRSREYHEIGQDSRITAITGPLN
jgi:hypothetical protein